MSASPEICVRVSFPGDRARGSRGEMVCHAERDIGFDAHLLEEYCFKSISDFDEELVFLAGAVAFADRALRRRQSVSWVRRIRVVMPVSDVARWRSKLVADSLVDALRFLTGDMWEFEFINRRGRLPKLKQRQLDLGAGEFVVIPFSNGLDSFSQMRLLNAAGGRAAPICVTAANSGIACDRTWIPTDEGARMRRVSIPFQVTAGKHAEPTFRSRSFVFAMLAGLAARLSESSRVVIPEAGQGSFGPSLVPFGAESPHRGSHPGFTMRMSRFFYAIWGKTITFDHPQKWRTKGQVLQDLKARGLESGWLSTMSCSRDQRHVRVRSHKRVHCGFCSGCLLRRVSVGAALLNGDPEEYFFPNLTADSLEKALSREARRTATANDRDIAVHAVLSMETLACFAESPSRASVIDQNLHEAFGSEGVTDENRGRMGALLAAHVVEWRDFTAKLGRDSWINRQLDIL